MTAARHVQPEYTTADMVEELCDHVQHSERVTVRRTNRKGKTRLVRTAHITHHRSLLDQLDKAITQSAAAQGGSRPGFSSSPPAQLEALATILKIDHEADQHIRAHGSIPGRSSTADKVRRVYSLDPYGKRTELTIRRWWTWARIITGWDLPPWRPNNTCPLCGKRGGLRVRLAHSTAMCAECFETWTPETLGLLVEHIRAEADATPQPRDTPQDPFQRRVAETDALRASVRSAPQVRPNQPPAVLRGVLDQGLSHARSANGQHQ